MRVFVSYRLTLFSVTKSCDSRKISQCPCPERCALAWLSFKEQLLSHCWDDVPFSSGDIFNTFKDVLKTSLGSISDSQWS